ncbi:MAG: DUF6249 domain-containing protein [Chloroflexia bacterium]
MDLLTAIVLISPCFLLIALMLFVVAMRYILYRERIGLAQHGIFLPEESFWDRLSQRTPRGVLWAGIITACCGLALLLGLYTIGLGPWLLGGLIPFFVGLGMVLIYLAGAPGRKRMKEGPQGERMEERELPSSTDAESDR